MQQGHVAEKHIVTAHEYMRANTADRCVDLTAAAQLADNFFDELEAETGEVATARDKELFLVYCHALTVWYYSELSGSEVGGTPLRHADGRVVQWVCTEEMAASMLSLMDMTYYYHMDSRVGVAFSDIANADAKGEPPSKRHKPNKMTNYTQRQYLHPQAYVSQHAYGGSAEDERYAVLNNCSMQQLYHRLHETMHASVEQVSDAVKRVRNLTMSVKPGEPPVRVMKVNPISRGTPSVSMLIAFLNKAHREVRRPHAQMKEVLQRVLSYPSQQARRYVTMWTLQGTDARAPLAGAQLLETMDVGPGARELCLKTSAVGDHATVLGSWTLDAYASYHYAQHFNLDYEAPPPPATAPCAYPHEAMEAAVQRMVDARGTAAKLRTDGRVANPPAGFGAEPVAMEVQ